MNRDHWNGYAFTRWQDLLPVAERLQGANHTTLRRQMDIARIAAPTGAESQRAHAIFDADTPLHCTVGSHRVHCPGIGDNGRGLAAMLALADILQAPAVVRMMKRPIELVATVGEEGEGNLLGHDTTSTVAMHAICRVPWPSSCSMVPVTRRSCTCRRIAAPAGTHSRQRWT